MSFFRTKPDFTYYNSRQSSKLCSISYKWEGVSVSVIRVGNIQFSREKVIGNRYRVRGEVGRGRIISIYDSANYILTYMETTSD